MGTKEMKCDWAYWYIPEDMRAKPKRITIKSKSSKKGGIEDKQEGDVTEGAENNENLITEESEKPWRKHMKRVSDDPKPVSKQTAFKTGLNYEKPWQANMRV